MENKLNLNEELFEDAKKKRKLALKDDNITRPMGWHSQLSPGGSGDAGAGGGCCESVEESLTEGYSDKFRQIVNYLKSVMDNNPSIKNWSYDDYRVEPDWAGSGMRFQVEFDTTNKEWREDDSVLRQLMRDVNNHFYGVSCSSGWGRDWEYYFTIHVDDKACNESLDKLTEQKTQNNLNESYSIEDKLPEKDRPILVWDINRQKYDLIAMTTPRKNWISEAEQSWYQTNSHDMINIHFIEYVYADQCGLDTANKDFYSVKVVVAVHGYWTEEVFETTDSGKAITTMCQYSKQYKGKNYVLNFDRAGASGSGECLGVIVTNKKTREVLDSTCDTGKFAKYNSTLKYLNGEDVEELTEKKISKKKNAINGGDPEYNRQMFNHMMGSGDMPKPPKGSDKLIGGSSADGSIGDVSSVGCSGGMGESLEPLSNGWEEIEDMRDEDDSPTGFAKKLSDNNFVWVTLTEAGWVIEINPHGEFTSIKNNSGKPRRFKTSKMAMNYADNNIGKIEAKYDCGESLNVRSTIGKKNLKEGYLDRKSMRDMQLHIAEVGRIPAGSVLMSENGRFEIHNIDEMDARRIVNNLRNDDAIVEVSSSTSGSYNFNKFNNKTLSMGVQRHTVRGLVNTEDLTK